MKYRKLRIAWSVVWGVVAVLVCVLWVRSRWYVELVTVPITVRDSAELMSAPGMLALALNYTSGYDRLRVIRLPVDDWERGSESGPGPLWGGFVRDGRMRALFIPNWLVVGIIAAFAVGPWVGRPPRRFGLRSLLIAVTVAAAVLGLIMWLARGG